MHLSYASARFVCLALPLLAGCAGDPAAEEVGDEPITASEEALSTGVSLVVKSASPGLAAQQWFYREVATRKVWGCYDYDVLQRTGWSLATWYRTYTFAPSAAGPVVNLERTLRASACSARMDGVNDVTVSLATPAGPVTGSFRVVPDGAASAAAVRCTRADTPFVDDTGATRTASALACTDARVKLPASGPMTVTISLAR
jgi:hypothetical protein